MHERSQHLSTALPCLVQTLSFSGIARPYHSLQQKYTGRPRIELLIKNQITPRDFLVGMPAAEDISQPVMGKANIIA